MMVGRGESVGTRSDWLGPVPWPTMVQAAERAGVALEEGPDGEGLPATFTDGWLRLEGASDQVVQALQLAMARRGGRAVQRRVWIASAQVGAGAVEVDGHVERSAIAPSGALIRQPDEPIELPFELDGDAVPDEALYEILDETEGAVVGLTRILDGPLAHLHPALSWRDVRLVVPSDWAPPSEVTITLDGEELPGRVVAGMLAALGRKLDTAGGPPDLERWTWRAARRAGLDAPPVEGADGWEVYRETWLALTAADRGRPAAAGKVAAWRFRSEGDWILPAAECALLAAVAPDGPWRTKLQAAASRGGCAMSCRSTVEIGAPWHLEPVALRTHGERLVVAVGEQVLVEAIRSADEITVLQAHGVQPEVASSHLRAALQQR